MAKAKQAKDETRTLPKRRKRRSTAEIRDRIIDAAVAEFGENGYSNATTAAIARRAGVVEALIFSHFDSKANLFRKAVFKPLDDHFATFVATHDTENMEEARFQEEGRAYVSDLVHFVRKHSDMFKSLVVNEAYAKSGSDSGGLHGLQDYFNKMSTLEGNRLKRRPKVSPPLIARISFASILACIMFDDWLFPVGVASEREIHEAICDFIMEGLNVNAAMQDSQPKPKRMRAKQPAG